MDRMDVLRKELLESMDLGIKRLKEMISRTINQDGYVYIHTGKGYHFKLIKGKVWELVCFGDNGKIRYIARSRKPLELMGMLERNEDVRRFYRTRRDIPFTVLDGRLPEGEFYYVYLLSSRSAGIGAIPDGAVEILREFLFYKRPLLQEEIDRYELMPIHYIPVNACSIHLS